MPIDVTVQDDTCNPVTGATVTASFSDNSPNAALKDAGNGHYTGTWTASSTSSNSTLIRVNATKQVTQQSPFGSVTVNITGSLNTPVTLTVGADPAQPVVYSGGAVGNANGCEGSVAAPGSYISIYGRALADSTQSANLPFPNSVGTTSVSIDGKAVPVYFVSTGQINALIPSDVSTDADHTLTVTRNGKTSQPVTIRVNPVQPQVIVAVPVSTSPAFENCSTTQSPVGQGAITNAAGQLTDKNTPVRAGDAIIIYAEGLGPVNPSVTVGQAAGASPLSTTTYPVFVRIGGFPAPVFYSGLAPGYSQLYQVNAIVPAGVPTGDAVPLTISVATGGITDRTSPPVTIAIKQ